MPHLPDDVVKLLEAAAVHPEGSGALFEGHLESVAALYQVHTQTIEELRACVEKPAVQDLAAQIVAAARRNATSLPLQTAPEQHPPNLTALIAKAVALPHGLDLLTRGPIETAALQLGAHPFLVDEARLHLAPLANGDRT